MTIKSRIEPKIGEIITINGVKYITQLASGAGCSKCAFRNSYCWNIVCNVGSRKDCTSVIFKKVETNMNEVKIQIPDNCELIMDGDTYVVREKKQEPPRSWREFCKNYPRTTNEYFIGYNSSIDKILGTSIPRDAEQDKNICVSKEEAEAFLALMQLRQLRKAWVGDWTPSGESYYSISYEINNTFEIRCYKYGVRSLSFPSGEMAEDFLNYFKDLCETAKILL